MKIKVILISTVIILIAVFVVIATLMAQPQSRSIEYTDTELAWLEDHANSSVYYYSDQDATEMTQSLIKVLQLKLGLNLVLVELGQQIEGPELILSYSEPNDGDYFVATRPLFIEEATYYKRDDIENEEDLPVGIIAGTEESFEDVTFARGFTWQAYTSQDELMAAVNQRQIEGFVLMGQEAFLLDVNKQLFSKSLSEGIPSKQLRFYIPESEELLAGIMMKATNHMVNDYTVKQIEEDHRSQLIKKIFNEIISENEKEFIEQTEKVSVGVEPATPMILQLGERMYGAPIGYLEKVSEVSGVGFDYIIGEQNELVNTRESHNISAFWLNRQREELEQGKPFIHSDYVVVGIGSTRQVDSLQKMSLVNVGTLLSDEISDQLIHRVPKENLVYYQNMDAMVEGLEQKSVDVVVMPRVAFNYYEDVMGNDKLDIRMKLSLQYETNIQFDKEASVLMSIMDKVTLLVDEGELIRTSLDEITIEEGGNYYWQLVLLTVLIALFIIGLLGARYRLNLREKRQMNYLFTHDQVTYLPNRFGLKHNLDAAIENGEVGVMFLIDIDHMREINERLGHHYGDQVIVELAQDLMDMVEEKVIFGRSGGDDFVLCMNDKTEKDVEEIVEKIRDIAKSYGMKKKALYDFTVSIASTTYPKYSVNYESFYRYLEYTLDVCREKNNRNGYMAFSEELYENYLSEQRMVEEIKTALTMEEFVLHIQPQIQLPLENLIGGEILVRWHHPDHGLIYPDQFLPVAEKNGLMRELDSYIIKKACAMIKEWQSRYDTMKISVNMSVESFEAPQMIERLSVAIEEAKIDPSWLTIEITEDMGFENMEKANTTFNALKAMGIGVALDDFGKGYSSLSYLDKLSFDVLKIDKAFIDHIHDSKKSLEIFKSIIGLAEIIGISVVAEGVEHIEQVEMLSSFGSPVVQGYYYSRPLSLPDFESFISDRR